MEQWKAVAGFEGRYEVSNEGRVRSLRYGNLILRGTSDKYGYRRVHLGWPGRQWFVHVLVAAAFLGPCPDGFERNHKDGNPSNNCVENLEYVTRLENARHSWHVLKRRDTRKLACPGSKHGMAKLTEPDILTIRARSRAGETLASIARHFHVCVPTVSMIVNRRTWRHVA